MPSLNLIDIPQADRLLLLRCQFRNGFLGRQFRVFLAELNYRFNRGR